MDHVFAPGIAQILLALGFLGGLVVGAFAGASRLLGWSDKRTKGIVTTSIKEFIESDELKEVVRVLGNQQLIAHEADCSSAHADLKAEHDRLKERDEDRKDELARARDATGQLNKNVIELATLIARLNVPKLEAPR